ncbi:MAG: hypothetical protein QOK14_267 [Frankiaceae bacterium]|jgi:uncharacterized protein (DUF2267 family)|nr:hypothetical protein [Frankiaceae bacterium]
MPEFDDLLLTVRTRSALRDPAEASLAISAVAGSLAACLGDPDRDGGATQPTRIPQQPVPAQLTLSVTDFVDEVARRTGWATGRSRYAAQAVLSALAEHDSELRQAVLRRLPDAAELFTPPGAPA